MRSVIGIRFFLDKAYSLWLAIDTINRDKILCNRS
jgi:hypothetical protein